MYLNSKLKKVIKTNLIEKISGKKVKKGERERVAIIRVFSGVHKKYTPKRSSERFPSQVPHQNAFYGVGEREAEKMESQAGSNGDGSCIIEAAMEEGSMESYRYYLSRRTLLEMLTDRGYDVPPADLSRSLSDFRAVFGPNPEPSRLRVCFPLVTSPSKKVYSVLFSC